MKLKILLPLCATLLAACQQPRSSGAAAVSEGLPYCFVEEQPDKRIAERIGRIVPIDLESVLLFPVVENGIINGQPVTDALGSPLLYKPGTDLDSLQFKGVDRWPVKRYMVWARGYYLQGIPHVFLYSDKVLGKQCFLVELTPIKPGTDVQKLQSAAIAELKAGGITVGPEMAIGDEDNFAALFRASVLKSWMRDPLSGYRRGMVNWGTPGSKVRFFLTEDDFKFMKSYLDAEQKEGGTNSVPAKPHGNG